MKIFNLFLLVFIIPLSCADSPEADESSTEILRVITINVWSGLDYKGSLKIGEYEDDETINLRTQTLIGQLKELSPDIIAVNEANKLPGYARSLSKELDYDQIHHIGLGGLRIGPIGLPVYLREGDVLLA